MHLMILLPGFLGFGTSVVFLILKTLADIGLYIATSGVQVPPASSETSFVNLQKR